MDWNSDVTNHKLNSWKFGLVTSLDATNVTATELSLKTKIKFKEISENKSDFSRRIHIAKSTLVKQN